MRSRAGFFWCSLWLTLLLLLPLILVVGFLARQRQTQQELRQAAANQSQLQIEPGAQSVWRMLLVVQKEEPAFVLVRADGRPEPFAAAVSYVASNAEYTPPVIYSNETRSKLVFMVEARPEPGIAAELHPGQPVSVSLP